MGFDDTDRLQEEVDRANQKEAEKWQHKLLVVATVYEVSFFKCQVYSHTYVRCAAWGVIQKGEFFKEVWNRWKDAVCFKYYWLFEVLEQECLLYAGAVVVWQFEPMA